MRLGLLAALVTLLPLTACSDGEPATLRLGLSSFAADPTRSPLYFTSVLCVAGDDARVKIIDVRAQATDDVVDRVAFEVSFDDDQTPPGVARQPVPDRFERAKGAEGLVAACDPDRAHAMPTIFAVLLPAPRRQPVVVEGVTLTYEIDGEERTVHEDALMAHCPRGTKPDDAGLESAPCTDG